MGGHSRPKQVDNVKTAVGGSQPGVGPQNLTQLPSDASAASPSLSPEEPGREEAGLGQLGLRELSVQGSSLPGCWLLWPCPGGAPGGVGLRPRPGAAGASEATQAHVQNSRGWGGGHQSGLGSRGEGAAQGNC